jgi:branched-chain amino acid transport system permease protein
MLYREAGQFKSSYAQDQQIFPILQDRIGVVAFLAFAFVVVPLIGDQYWLSAILTPFLILALATLGLNILTGYAGQLSLGTAAFMAVGAFMAYNFVLRLPWLGIIPSFILAGLCAAAVGIVFGLPSLRIKGFYLAVATLACQFFVLWAIQRWGWITNHSASGVITAQKVVIRGHEIGFVVVLASVLLIAGWFSRHTSSIGGKSILAIALAAAVGAYLGILLGKVPFPSIEIVSPAAKYVFTLTLVTVMALLAKNLMRSETGRAFMAVRDMDVAASVIGIPMMKTKLLAFAISSFYCGVAGAVYAYTYLGTVEPEAFTLDLSFRVLFMVIIGGVGSILGSFLGAAFITLFPIFLNIVSGGISHAFGVEISHAMVSNLELIIFGGLIIFFLIVEPHGLARLWQVTKEKLRLWPFPH